MKIHLPSDLETFVRERVDSGQNLTASDVIEESLRLLQYHSQVEALKINALRAEIRKGLDSLDGGVHSTATGTEILERVKKRLEAQHRHSE